MAKTPARRARRAPATEAKKAATEALFAEADAKGGPTQDEIDAIAARLGVTGF